MQAAKTTDQIDFPATDVHRLGSIAGMLGSDFPGERANAAEAATKLLRQHGWTWRLVVERAFAYQPALAANEDAPDWRAQLAACQLYQHRMSPWERAFCAALARWRGRPSAKQLAVLARLFERLAS